MEIKQASKWDVKTDPSTNLPCLQIEVDGINVTIVLKNPERRDQDLTILEFEDIESFNIKTLTSPEDRRAIHLEDCLARLESVLELNADERRLLLKDAIPQHCIRLRTPKNN